MVLVLSHRGIIPDEFTFVLLIGRCAYSYLSQVPPSTLGNISFGETIQLKVT